MKTRRTSLRSIAACAAATAVTLTLTGCAAPGPADVPTPTVTQTVSPSVQVQKKAPPSPAVEAWPLTGLPGEVEVRPAVAVKIENSPEARPQTGLEDADIVWEEIVEGGISRYIAVWNSVLPKEIGPIRSIRPMDGNIIGPTHGLMVCSGGKSQFIASAREAELQVLSQDGGNAGFYRVQTRYAPHNVYADPADFVAQADKDHLDSPVPQFEYAPSPAAASATAAGKQASAIALNMSNTAHPRWVWDEAASAWQRYEGDNVAEAASGTQLSAVNVIAMKVDIRTAPGRDPAGNSIPESIVIGTGSGFAATGGKILHINWSKESATAVPVLTDDAGSAVKLAPGNTWVELVPSYGAWSTEAAGPAGAPSSSTGATPSTSVTSGTARPSATTAGSTSASPAPAGSSNPASGR